MNEGNAAAKPSPPTTKGQATITLGPWHAVIGTLVLATILIVTIFVVQHYSAATDAGTILGIVIPALATIGAAVFGITVAYNAGTARGAAAGKAVAKAEVADQLEPTLAAARQAVNEVAEKIETAGTTSEGDRTVTVAGSGATPLEIDGGTIDAAKENLAHLEGLVTGMRVSS